MRPTNFRSSILIGDRAIDILNIAPKGNFFSPLVNLLYIGILQPVLKAIVSVTRKMRR